MSVELATEELIYSKGERGIIGQVASNKGYSDLIAASKGYPALAKFLDDGATEDTTKVQADLVRLAAVAPKDIASTALNLRKLISGHPFVMVTRGCE